MPCAGRYATAQEYASVFCLTTPLSAPEQTAIEAALDLAAGDIHGARATVDACDCTLSAAATVMLKRLNIILAGIFYKCTCAPVNLSDSDRRAYLTWAQGQLTAIMDGRLEVCDSETGSAYPAVGWAEHAGTEFAQAETILKAEERYP